MDDAQGFRPQVVLSQTVPCDPRYGGRVVKRPGLAGAPFGDHVDQGVMILNSTRRIGMNGIDDIDQPQHVDAHRGFLQHFAPRRLENGFAQFLGAAG